MSSVVIMSPRRTMPGRTRLIISSGFVRPAASMNPITRSASRMAATSGVVTTMALSAAAMAFLNPCSMPAGESIRDVVEVFLQLVAEFLHLCARYCALVPRLGGGNYIQVLRQLVSNHCLLGLAHALYDLHQVIDDAVLQAHDNV